MKEITLETADDIQTVWSNWHGDLMVYINDSIQTADEAGNQTIVSELSRLKEIIERPPVKANYSINTEVMEDSADLIIAIVRG